VIKAVGADDTKAPKGAKAPKMKGSKAPKTKGAKASKASPATA
jgi:hypothetical protein